MNSMKADHSFHIGKQHQRTGKPCQDYALSGTHHNTTYAVVSDGCSSGGHTDIGARLLSLATRNALQTEIANKNQFTMPTDIPNFNSRQQRLLNTYKETLGLNTHDLLATSLWSIATANHFVYQIIGDGVVAIVTESETIVHCYEWQKNTPFYLAYDGDQRTQFTHFHQNNSTPFSRETWKIGADQASSTVTNYSVDEGMSGVTEILPITKECPIIALALFSDGVQQVSNHDWKTVVQDLLAFKSTEGAFAVRRMNRWLKDAARQGSEPIDDIAYAVITNRPT